jgi:hypothetical protein
MDWKNNSIVIYSNFPFHVEDWSPQSIDKGTGGSEEAVIYLSQKSFKLGCQVTIFNRCGDMEGEYSGVVYPQGKPYHHEEISHKTSLFVKLKLSLAVQSIVGLLRGLRRTVIAYIEPVDAQHVHSAIDA